MASQQRSDGLQPFTHSIAPLKASISSLTRTMEQLSRLRSQSHGTTERDNADEPYSTGADPELSDSWEPNRYESHHLRKGGFVEQGNRRLRGRRRRHSDHDFSHQLERDDLDHHYRSYDHQRRGYGKSGVENQHVWEEDSFESDLPTHRARELPRHRHHDASWDAEDEDDSEHFVEHPGSHAAGPAARRLDEASAMRTHFGRRWQQELNHLQQSQQRGQSFEAEHKRRSRSLGPVLPDKLEDLDHGVARDRQEGRSSQKVQHPVKKEDTRNAGDSRPTPVPANSSLRSARSGAAEAPVRRPSPVAGEKSRKPSPDGHRQQGQAIVALTGQVRSLQAESVQLKTQNESLRQQLDALAKDKKHQVRAVREVWESKARAAEEARSQQQQRAEKARRQLEREHEKALSRERERCAQLLSERDEAYASQLIEIRTQAQAQAQHQVQSQAKAAAKAAAEVHSEMQRHMDALEREREVLGTQRSAMEHEHASLIAQVEELQKRLEDASRELSSRENQRRVQAGDLLALRRQLAQEGQWRQEAEASHRRHTLRLAERAARADIEEHAQRGFLSMAVEEIRWRDAQWARLTRRVADAERMRLQETEKQLVTLRQSAEVHHRARREAEENLLRNKVEGERRLADANADNDVIRAREENAQRECAELRRRAHDLHEKGKAARSRCRELMDTVSHLRAQLESSQADTESQIAVLRASTESAQDRERKQQRRLEAMREEMEQLKSNIEREHSSKQDDASALAAQVKQFREALLETENMNRQQQDMITSLQQDIRREHTRRLLVEEELSSMRLNATAAGMGTPALSHEASQGISPEGTSLPRQRSLNPLHSASSRSSPVKSGPHQQARHGSLPPTAPITRNGHGPPRQPTPVWEDAEQRVNGVVVGGEEEDFASTFEGGNFAELGDGVDVSYLARQLGEIDPPSLPSGSTYPAQSGGVSQGYAPNTHDLEVYDPPAFAPADITPQHLSFTSSSSSPSLRDDSRRVAPVTFQQQHNVVGETSNGREDPEDSTRRSTLVHGLTEAALEISMRYDRQLQQCTSHIAELAMQVNMQDTELAAIKSNLHGPSSTPTASSIGLATESSDSSSALLLSKSLPPASSARLGRSPLPWERSRRSKSKAKVPRRNLTPNARVSTTVTSMHRNDRKSM
eukprot:NODE_49_length_3778_cov_32.310271_g43_i0.p1 GENE.NODE_49_length_3778_cov_32.310271_g43_i0~~NODE_49_length_3778_cov_32.310271_g43_i0.p1  ORF type:complete len:1153 (+),score=241.87 NODE_49_length_3778_cov_32.310271_g43_i0:209-3667(+)